MLALSIALFWQKESNDLNGFRKANSSKLKEWIDLRRPPQMVNYSLVSELAGIFVLKIMTV